MSCRMCAARAADGEDTLFLGVDVEKPLAFQNRRVKADRAVHAGFLVDGKEALEPRVREVVRIEHGQSHRNGNAVVASECRALGADKVAIYHKLQTVGQEVDRALGRFFRDHVEVALHDDCGRGFIAGGRWLHDNDVIQAVLMDFQSAIMRELHAVVADGLRVAGAVRNGAEIFKEGENAFRFKLV